MKSRITIIQKPLPKTPKKCLVTGRADGDIVDFGTDVSVPGPEPHIYLKRSVVEEAGEVCGMVPGAKFDKQAERLAELEAENEQLRKIAEPLQAIHAAEAQIKEAISVG